MSFIFTYTAFTEAKQVQGDIINMRFARTQVGHIANVDVVHIHAASMQLGHKPIYTD
jgi:hypothetical protein